MGTDICIRKIKSLICSGASVLQSGWFNFDIWRLLVFAIAAFVMLPIGVLFQSFLSPEKEIWDHFAQTILTDLFINTINLTGGVLAGTFFIGVSLAWLTSVLDYPGRRFFSWALLLPLAVPTYVLSFVFLGIFDYSGPVQSIIRLVFPDTKTAFPDIRSAFGIVVVMSLALYPYVYLMARSAFKTQGVRGLEAAQSLGLSRTKAFFSVSLPMARPWIAGGLMLVMMEVLADFGSVSIFNFNTFTTAIYKAWFGFFSLPAAAQLSSVLVLIALLIIFLEQKARAKMRYSQVGRLAMVEERIPLTGWKGWCATFYSGSIVLIAFVIPFGQLIYWSIEIFREEISMRYFSFFVNSIILAGTTALVVLASALILSYAKRRDPKGLVPLMARISTMGYALPGTVLAVGVVIIFAFADNFLRQWIYTLVGFSSGPLFHGTVIAVIAACSIRFMAAGFHSVDNAMNRITPNMDEAATGLGVTGFELLRRVHVPIIKQGLLTASLLVFVEVMKEMPITLMTRPFGWDTLAVKIYELTSEGEWQRAALPSVVLILGGLLPVILLNRQSDSNNTP